MYKFEEKLNKIKNIPGRCKPPITVQGLKQDPHRLDVCTHHISPGSPPTGHNLQSCPWHLWQVIGRGQSPTPAYQQPEGRQREWADPSGSPSPR